MGHTLILFIIQIFPKKGHKDQFLRKMPGAQIKLDIMNKQSFQTYIFLMPF